MEDEVRSRRGNPFAVVLAEDTAFSFPPDFESVDSAATDSIFDGLSVPVEFHLVPDSVDPVSVDFYFHFLFSGWA